MKNRITRKGFTLVELLIVIVVIGILVSMMMLSSTEAVTSAKANNIVSNLRNLKTAALAYYTDNMDDLSRTGATAPKIADVMVYLNSTDIADRDSYALVFEGSTPSLYSEKRWYIRYHLGTVSDAKSDAGRVAAKLKGRARSVGLFKGESKTKDSIGDTPSFYDDSTWGYVFYKVR